MKVITPSLKINMIKLRLRSKIIFLVLHILILLITKEECILLIACLIEQSIPKILILEKAINQN
jgi:hypothetical protein